MEFHVDTVPLLAATTFCLTRRVAMGESFIGVAGGRRVRRPGCTEGAVDVFMGISPEVAEAVARPAIFLCVCALL